MGSCTLKNLKDNQDFTKESSSLAIRMKNRNFENHPTKDKGVNALPILMKVSQHLPEVERRFSKKKTENSMKMKKRKRKDLIEEGKRVRFIDITEETRKKEKSKIIDKLLTK